MELCNGFPKVVDVLAKNAPKGKPGRKKAGVIADARQQLDRHKGDTVPVLQAKLAERFPKVWADFLAGKYRTVRAAATAAGIVRLPTTLEKLRWGWLRATPDDRAAFLRFVFERLIGA